MVEKGNDMASDKAHRISVAVVGGGIGGIAAATMLKRAGYDDVTVFERNSGLGGVWQTNTYPGAACDVPSHFYEFSYALNPDWSCRYAPQAEIKAYLEGVVRDHRRRGIVPVQRRGALGQMGRCRTLGARHR